MAGVWRFEADLVCFFYFKAAESLAGRGSQKSDLAKSCFQRTYMQNLESKRLRTAGIDLLDRHCLDHDGATSIADARSDVTCWLWKSLGNILDFLRSRWTVRIYPTKCCRDGVWAGLRRLSVTSEQATEVRGAHSSKTATMGQPRSGWCAGQAPWPALPSVTGNPKTARPHILTRRGRMASSLPVKASIPIRSLLVRVGQQT